MIENEIILLKKKKGYKLNVHISNVVSFSVLHETVISNYDLWKEIMMNYKVLACAQ